MKLTKRILCFALVLTLIFALCACDKNKEEKDDNTTNPGGFSTVVDPTTTQSVVDDWASNLEGDQMYNDATLAW